MSISDSLPVRNRPKTIKELIGQKYAKTVLTGALLKDKIPRAIMIGGPTGLGKTTLARILANTLNCQKRKGAVTCLSKKKPVEICNSCKLSLKNSHPDVIENNTADSRGIDDMRQLVKLAAYLPTFDYRVIILDEIQQVTPQGAQLLLKPLEEPPANTIWILPTMEPDRVPEAIRNRCKYIPLSPINKIDLMKLVRRVSKKEGYDLSDKVVTWISSVASSRPREALNVLDSMFSIMDYESLTELDELPENMEQLIIQSGIIGNEPMALVILSFLYVQNPLVFAFLQRGVTDSLIRDLYYLQDSFVAHMSFGNKSWRWRSVIKAVTKVIKTEIRFNAYNLPVKYHISLCALLGKATLLSRQYGDPGIALRQVISEWFMLNIDRGDLGTKEIPQKKKKKKES